MKTIGWVTISPHCQNDQKGHAGCNSWVTMATIAAHRKMILTVLLPKMLCNETAVWSERKPELCALANGTRVSPLRCLITAAGCSISQKSMCASAHQGEVSRRLEFSLIVHLETAERLQREPHRPPPGKGQCSPLLAVLCPQRSSDATKMAHAQLQKR